MWLTQDKANPIVISVLSPMHSTWQDNTSSVILNCLHLMVLYENMALFLPLIFPHKSLYIHVCIIMLLAFKIIKPIISVICMHPSCQDIGIRDDEYFRLNEVNSLLRFVSDDHFESTKRYKAFAHRQQEVIFVYTCMQYP